MARKPAPVLIAYDGSEFARAAVQHAGELFAGRPAVLATVWEPGLAAVTLAVPGGMGVSTLPPDPATVEAVDRAQREHASAIAAEGQSVGSHGITGLRARLLGSVSRKLVERCDRPVLVTRGERA